MPDRCSDLTRKIIAVAAANQFFYADYEAIQWRSHHRGIDQTIGKKLSMRHRLKRGRALIKINRGD